MSTPGSSAPSPVRYLLHPLNEIIRNDPHFFEKPSDIPCFHCSRPCNDPAPRPFVMHFNHFLGVFNVHNVKFACDWSCARFLSRKKWNLTALMMIEVFGVKDPLTIPMALELFALRRFGGTLTDEEFTQWKALPTLPDAELDLYLKNPFYSYQFHDRGPLRDQFLAAWSVKLEGELCCMHCRDPIHGIPCPAFQKYDSDNGIWYGKGLFCTPECSMRHTIIRNETMAQIRVHLLEKWLKEFVTKGLNMNILKKPSRRLRVEYFGPLDPDQYHSPHAPFRSVVQQPYVDYPVFVLPDFPTGLMAIDQSPKVYLWTSNPSNQSEDARNDVFEEAMLRYYEPVYHTVSESLKDGNPPAYRLHVMLTCIQVQNLTDRGKDMIETLLKRNHV